MRRVVFQDVLYGAARLLGISNPARDLSPDRAATLCQYINRHVATGWRYDFAPEWLRTEKRRFRPVYVAGNFVEAGDELYFPAAQKYYQALREQAAATEAPATLSGTEYVENSAWWAECRQRYPADAVVVGDSYDVGEKVRNPDDGECYQCHTAGTFALARFGRLTAFDKYVASAQAGETVMDGVKQFTRRDPRVYPENPWPLRFTKSANGYQLPTDAPNEVWVQFRTTPPVFTTVKWVSGTAYDEGALVYYQGETFRSAIGNNDAAVDGVVNWKRVEFPALLEGFVTRATQADALRDQKQTDRARAEMEAALDDLGDDFAQEFDSQGQYERATVRMG